MTIGINGLPPSGMKPVNTPAQGHKPDRHTEPKTGKDEVNLTGLARHIEEIVKMLKDVPVVDTKRVESLRAEIESGRYQPDAGRIADKMVAFERTLSDNL